MIPQLPKQWLVHNITYAAKTTETDDYGNPIKLEPIEISNVRYDPSFEHTRNTVDNKIAHRGVIFVDSVHSEPVPDFVEDSSIFFQGRELILKKVIPCYHPIKNTVRHIELEVL